MPITYIHMCLFLKHIGLIIKDILIVSKSRCDHMV